jgi:hypothetical protein
MESFFVALLSGVVATLLMVAVMYALVWRGFHHGDMIRVLGSDLTEKPKRYFSMGMTIYFATGVLLSWVYYLVLDFFKFDSVLVSNGFAGFMGFSQGFILMHFYVEELGARHPIKLYKKFWIPIAVAHWLGHWIYGASIGSLISAYLIFDGRGFLIGLLVNLFIVASVTFFANKKRIFALLRRRREISHVIRSGPHQAKARP